MQWRGGLETDTHVDVMPVAMRLFETLKIAAGQARISFRKLLWARGASEVAQCTPMSAHRTVITILCTLCEEPGVVNNGTLQNMSPDSQ